MPDLESREELERPEEESQLYPEGKIRKGSADWLLQLGRAANVIAGLSALASLVAHAMSLSLAGRLEWSHLDVARTGLLQIYCIAIAVLVMAVETEWEVLLSQMKLLESWVGRGLLQIFLGLMTLELKIEGDTDFEKSLKLYRKASGLSVTGCGVFYLVGGLLCVGVCKRSRQRRHLERAKAERDLAALSKRQDELKALLASTSRD